MCPKTVRRENRESASEGIAHTSGTTPTRVALVALSAGIGRTEPQESAGCCLARARKGRSVRKCAKRQGNSGGPKPRSQLPPQGRSIAHHAFGKRPQPPVAALPGVDPALPRRLVGLHPHDGGRHDGDAPAADEPEVHDSTSAMASPRPTRRKPLSTAASSASRPDGSDSARSCASSTVRIGMSRPGRRATRDRR